MWRLREEQWMFEKCPLGGNVAMKMSFGLVETELRCH